MKKNLIIGGLFIATVLLAVLHNASIEFSWYYFYPFIDIPIHILGGLVVGFLVFIFFSSTEGGTASVEKDISPLNQLFLILLITFLVSVGWEVFELVFYLTNDAGLSLNTFSDIIFGLIGGAIGWMLLQLISHIE